MKKSKKRTSKNGIPLGRPSKKTPKLTEKILDLVTQGKTDKQIAEIIGVSERTINWWKKQDLDFLHAYRQYKQELNDHVAASLYKRAVGYQYKEQQVTKDGIVEIEKHAQPDTKAQIFYLKNKDSKNWKDRVEVEQESKQTLFIQVGDEEESVDL